jgi:hypothetical protein
MSGNGLIRGDIDPACRNYIHTGAFCERLAERDELERDRAWLIAMAERWRELAQTTERMD